jgi:glycosyltransferase involved in cell wall biosynthesis
MARKSLFVSYDGMTDPLGQSQVIPYLMGLVENGFEIDLISFEKPARMQQNGAFIRDELERNGISWHPLSYTKSPPVLSTVWDLIRMRRTAERLHAARKFDLIHCRSYLSALVGLGMKRSHGTRFLFDMRGFWADEKVEARAWNLDNPLFRSVYRFFKRKESDFVREADAIVSLTHAGLREMHSWPTAPAPGTPRKVSPCCSDFDLFEVPTPRQREDARTRLQLSPKDLVVAYLGSLGTWYMLEEMLDFFAELLRSRPEARLLFVTPDEPEIILQAAVERGVPVERIVIRSAQRREVPSLLAAADLGLFFIRPTYSKQSSSPTKLGELLAMGLPVITNGGVGDVQNNITAVGGGLVVESFDQVNYKRVISRLDSILHLDPEQIRERAMALFDLRSAVAGYVDLYETVLDGSGSKTMSRPVEKV